jgi:hypothetical protein
MRPARHTLSDHKIYEDVTRELQIPQMAEFIEKYTRDWKEHINRMNSDKTPKINTVMYLVIRYRVWIGNCIYWTLTTCNYNSLQR